MLSNFRSPATSFFLSFLLLFISCNGPTLLDEKVSFTENSSFDYSIYENNKGNLLDLSTFDDISYDSNIQFSNEVLNKINIQLGTQLDLDHDFKSLNFKSKKEISEWGIQNKVIDENDVVILTNLNKNLKFMKIEDALNRLEFDVNSSISQIEKKVIFEKLANVVKLLEYQDKGMFSSSIFEKSSCDMAIVGLIFSFITLILACNPAGVVLTVGIACYFAGANFIRASIALGMACEEK